MREAVKRVAAIALGSNLASEWGDREANLREAVRRVGLLGEVQAVSSFYDTAPVGYTEQPRFLNGAMLLETELEPAELMCELLAIERAMGRDRAQAPAKGPRVIDLDLLLMGDVGCGLRWQRSYFAASRHGRAAFRSGAAGRGRAGDGRSALGAYYSGAAGTVGGFR
jgi:2-amino-4-hydroxy-6-hydroxymethyldihydropteridine diphosphokinase